MEPLRLEPIYNRTIWAGQRLALIRGRVPAGEGTSWEVSVHPSAQSVVAEGAHAGLTLAALIDEDAPAARFVHAPVPVDETGKPLA